MNKKIEQFIFKHALVGAKAPESELLDWKFTPGFYKSNKDTVVIIGHSKQRKCNRAIRSMEIVTATVVDFVYDYVHDEGAALTDKQSLVILRNELNKGKCITWSAGDIVRDANHRCYRVLAPVDSISGDQTVFSKVIQVGTNNVCVIPIVDLKCIKELEVNDFEVVSTSSGYPQPAEWSVKHV